MKFGRMLLLLGALSTAAGQTDSQAIVTNIESAKWEHEKGAPAGSDGVMLRSDEATGGMDLLVRFPAGHVIPPHWHDSNERIFVAEGQLTLRQDNGDSVLQAGGFAFLPARQVQRIACTSKTRCTFYLSWDGKHASHAAK